MPLILSENQYTESGIVYDDNTGISYQFPKMYRRTIKPGTPFAYYRGRKRKVGRQPQVYFGTGIVGDVEPDSASIGRLKCEILNYRAFPAPVPFKVGKIGYLEVGGKRKGYFQQGVRAISEAEFAAILEAASFSPENRSENISDENALYFTALRMTKTALQTTLSANGQNVIRRIKDKKLSLSPDALAKYLRKLLAQQKNQCAITGIELQLDGKCSDIELLCSLDRIDSSGHYSEDNLQVVCRFINRWKSSDNDAQFRRLVTLLKSTK